jgi:hypothetical protein
VDPEKHLDTTPDDRRVWLLQIGDIPGGGIRRWRRWSDNASLHRNPMSEISPAIIGAASSFWWTRRENLIGESQPGASFQHADAFLARGALRADQLNGIGPKPMPKVVFQFVLASFAVCVRSRSEGSQPNPRGV